MDMLSVPIACETHAGWGRLHGMLAFDGQRLRLSYQTVDGVLGVLKSTPQTVDIPLAGVREIVFGLGWFWLRPSIELCLTDFVTSASLPGFDRGRARLRVEFRDRHHARRLVEQARFACSEALHSRLVFELDQMHISAARNAPVLDPMAQQLPPPPPMGLSRQREVE